MHFIIDRKTWYRGMRNSALLKEDGRMCCMGQVACQLEIPKEELLRVMTTVTLAYRFSNNKEMLN